MYNIFPYFCSTCDIFDNTPIQFLTSAEWSYIGIDINDSHACNLGVK